MLAVRSVFEADRSEVHVLATPGRDGADIAADVRSILAVQGFDVALGDVHVVQLQPSTAEEAPAAAAAAAAATTAPDGDRARVELVDVVVLFEDRGARVVSTLRRGTQSVTGTASCIAATASVRRAVAEATLTALLELLGSGDEMALDAVLVIASPPHEVAIVLLEMAVPAGEANLVGAALVRGQGIHDAVGRAVLDATNRRLSRPSG